MILKTSIGSLWKMKVILWWLRFRFKVPYGQWLRLYVITEEYVTNFIKYGNLNEKQSCWISAQRFPTRIVVTLFDKGQVFDPFIERKNSVGLPLMTKLLPAKYIRKKNFNIFKLAISVRSYSKDREIKNM